MNLYDDDRANSESSILTAPSPGLGMSSPPAGGGVPVEPQSGGAADAPNNTPRRSGGGIGQAVLGKIFPPYAQMRAARGQADELRLRSLTAGIAAMKDGLEMALGLEGEKHAAFVANYKGQLDKFEPGLGDAFENLTANPETAGSIIEWAQESDTLTRALKSGGLKSAKKILSSPEALKTIQAEIDSKRMPILLRKGQTFVVGFQKLVPEEMAEQMNKDGRISASELMAANEWLKANKPDIAKTLAFTDRELEVVSRNADAFYGSLGIVSPKDEADLAKDKAKKGNQPTPSRTVKKTVDGKVVDQLQEWDGSKWADSGEATPHHKPEDALPKEVKDKVAAIQLKVLDGKQPTTEERAFLDEIARTNPLVAAMRDALGGGGAVPKPAPAGAAPKDVTERFNADEKMKGNTLGAQTDKGWEVKKNGKVIGYWK